jgi:hypothetical protein
MPRMTQPEIITRYIDRIAYARNGNASNPTVYYRWRCRAGGYFRTLRAAKQAMAEDFGVTDFQIVRENNPRYKWTIP